MSVIVTEKIAEILRDFGALKLDNKEAKQLRSDIDAVRDVLSNFDRPEPENKTQTIVKVRLVSSICAAIRKHKSDPNEGPWLHEIIKGSKLHICLPLERKPTPKTQEFIERTKRIQRMIEDQEYAKMVEGVVSGSPFGTKQEPDGINEWNNMFSSISVGINLIIAMITCFVVGYFLGFQATHDQVKAIVCGVVGLIGALLVESALFIIRASRFVEPPKQYT